MFLQYAIFILSISYQSSFYMSIWFCHQLILSIKKEPISRFLLIPIFSLLFLPRQQAHHLHMRWDVWTALFFTSSVCGNMSSASSVCGNLSIVTASALHQQTRIEISYILSNLITVIFCYQISLKSLKTLSLSQVSFPLLFPLYYIVPWVFTNSDKGKNKGKKIL